MRYFISDMVHSITSRLPKARRNRAAQGAQQAQWNADSLARTFASLRSDSSSYRSSGENAFQRTVRNIIHHY